MLTYSTTTPSTVQQTCLVNENDHSKHNECYDQNQYVCIEWIVHEYKWSRGAVLPTPRLGGPQPSLFGTVTQV